MMTLAQFIETQRRYFRATSKPASEALVEWRRAVAKLAKP
jgi:hypothetical protein